MVIKMLPQQVSNSWEYIRHGIEATKPAMLKLTDEGYRNILKNLLVGNLQCWAIVEPSEEDSFYGFFLTTIAEDYVSGTRFLNVYDLFSFKPFKPGTFEECVAVGVEFAKANKCSTITAYSDIPTIISLAKKCGFKTDCIYMTMEV